MNNLKISQYFMRLSEVSWHLFFLKTALIDKVKNFREHISNEVFLNFKCKIPMSFQNILSSSQLSSLLLTLSHESSQHRFLSNWVEDGQEKLLRRRTEFNGLFTWFTIPEKEVHRVPFFCAHDTCDGKFIFFAHTTMFGNFPIAKCGLNCFEVCLCTLHPPSPNFASSSTENSWTSVAHAGKFLQVIYQIGNHAIYRRLTHFQHPNQILSNLSPQISSEINWKTLSQQQVWSIVRVSADKKLHTLRHHEQWTFCNGRRVKQQIYAREIFISPRTPRENLRKQ